MGNSPLVTAQELWNDFPKWTPAQIVLELGRMGIDAKETDDSGVEIYLNSDPDPRHPAILSNGETKTRVTSSLKAMKMIPVSEVVYGTVYPPLSYE